MLIKITFFKSSKLGLSLKVIDDKKIAKNNMPCEKKYSKKWGWGKVYEISGWVSAMEQPPMPQKKAMLNNSFLLNNKWKAIKKDDKLHKWKGSIEKNSYLSGNR